MKRRFVLMIFFVVTALAAMAQNAVGVKSPEKASGLSGLKAEDPAQHAVLVPAFSPAVTEYYMYVQSDVYGIRFTPTFEKSAFASVAMNGTGVKAKVATIASGQSFVLDLSQRYEDMRLDVEATAEIAVDDKIYTIKVQREDANYLYNAFTLNKKATTDGKEMYYWLHLPANYDASKEYPVVLYLHGSGQRFQPEEMVLMRNQAATTFVKFGYDCIVIAPQCNYIDRSANLGWANSDLSFTVFGNGAYSILQDIVGQYSVDINRIYVTGLSMGGNGTYAMIANYPGVFAAGLANCGYLDEVGLIKLTKAMKDRETPLWIVHGTGDESVNFTMFEQITQGLDKAGISYKSTVYGDEVFLYPMRHFSWQPAYADKKILDWMFSQSNDNRFGKLIDVKVEDPSLKPAPVFKDKVFDYSMDVQHDVYGVRFTPYGEGPFRINGKTVSSGEPYVFQFSPSDAMPAETYITGLTGIVKIETVGGVYTYTIKKEGIGDILSQFEKQKYRLPDGGEMYYLLYVPKNYDVSKAYPVVLFLHGSGKRWQEAENILRSNQGATGFYKYNKECIIIVPQCNYTDISTNMKEGWADVNMNMSKFGKAAFDILQLVKSKYNIDPKREYLTGLSMGGNGAMSMAANYPDEFAAVLFCAAYGDDFSRLANLAKSKTKIWIVQAESDPVVQLQNYGGITSKLDSLGIPYISTLFQPQTFLHPSAHFSWVPMYANYQGCLDWMFKQSR